MKRPPLFPVPILLPPAQAACGRAQDQEAVPAADLGAARFLKTAKAVFSSAFGDRLVRTALHMAVTDLQSATAQKVDSTADVNPHPVASVLPPPAAVSVAPAQVFQTGSANSSGSGAAS